MTGFFSVGNSKKKPDRSGCKGTGMKTIYRTDSSDILTRCKQPQEGCWIRISQPDQQDIQFVKETFDVPAKLLHSVFDQSESAHIEQKDGLTLLVAGCPVREDSESDGIPRFAVVPLAMLIARNCFVTVSSDENPYIENLLEEHRDDIDSRAPVRFFLMLMLCVAEKFQEYLREIEAISEETADALYKKMNNSGIRALMELNKSLILFSAALKADQFTLEKIQKTELFSLSRINEQMLEEIHVEYEQASSMCEVYLSINEFVFNGCSSIISNDMNLIMKRLTFVTIVLSVPALVYGYYGMNVEDLPLAVAWFPLFLSLAGCLAAWLYLRHSSRYR